MTTTEEIENFSAAERDIETTSARIMQNAVRDFRQALSSAHPLTTAGDNLVDFLTQAIDISEADAWFAECRAAGILNDDQGQLK